MDCSVWYSDRKLGRIVLDTISRLSQINVLIPYRYPYPYIRIKIVDKPQLNRGMKHVNSDRQLDLKVS